MNKITANHLSRSAYVYVRQSTADQSPTIRKADVAYMGWRRAQTCSAGRMWWSSTTTSVARAAAVPAPDSTLGAHKSTPALLRYAKETDAQGKIAARKRQENGKGEFVRMSR